MGSGTATGGTYLDAIAGALRRTPDREAIVSGDRRVTYAEAADLISRMQQVLAAGHVVEGASVVALAPNVPEVFLAQVAAAFLGATYTGLHPLGSVDDHVTLCDDVSASVLITHPAYAEVASQIAERCAGIEAVFTLGEAALGSDLLAACDRVEPRPLTVPDLDRDRTIWLPYTGGTTGKPKGVMHSFRSMTSGMLAVLSSWELPTTPRYLAASPITHAAVLPVVPTLVRGGTVVLNQGFDPDRWLDTVRREHINFAFAVPTTLYMLLDRLDSAPADVSSLETILYGSAPMSAHRVAEAIDRFGPILTQAYGQTESCGVGAILRKDEHDPVRRPELITSCGQIVPGGRLALLDNDNRPVPTGDVGEICLRGDWVMSGYHGNQAATEEVLSAGWLHTGDLGVNDSEGYTYIVDRKKDMIITGAFNVYPREIEEVIASEAAVSSVAVVGLPDEKWGEAVTAFIVPRPGADVDIDALKKLVRARKGPHQTPKRVHVVPELPLTSVGKIDKKALRETYRPEAGRRA